MNPNERVTTEKAWKITDFTKKLIHFMKVKYDNDDERIHQNTVDNWFKALEDQNIHFVSRIHGEKVYMEKDFEIACFMYEGRKKKGYPVDFLCKEVQEHFEVNPYPPEETKEQPIIIDEVKGELRKEMDTRLDAFKEELMEAREELLKAVREEAIKTVQSEMINFRNLLPDPLDKEQERKELIHSIEKLLPTKEDKEAEREAILDQVKQLIPDPVVEHNKQMAEFELRMKAATEAADELHRLSSEAWSKQPEDIRFITEGGFFKKKQIENVKAKEEFFRDYRLQHYASIEGKILSRLKEERKNNESEPIE